MHYKTLPVALFAALATAHQHAPRHFHLRRALNETGPSTTLTVFTTEIHTITSCAPTVTDCPASEATSEYVVTETRALTTTVCPVKDASSISSAIISGVTAKPTGYGPGPAATHTGEGPASDTTLTYTLGAGTSTTIVTTIIKHTSTATVYAVSTGDSSGEGSEGYPTGAAGDETTAEPTTTIKTTSTSTKYITVYPASSGVSAQGAGGECVPVTVTVAATTVTVSAQTITVTETAAAGAPTIKAVEDSSAVTSAQDGVDAPSASDVVIVPSTATVVPVPPTHAPYVNGTDATGGSYTTKESSSSILPTGYANHY